MVHIAIPMQDYWKTKLTELDTELCKTIALLIDAPCVPKNGGDHYFLEVDYRKHTDPQYILDVWGAIEASVGDRLIDLKDDPERQCLWAYIKFCNK